MKKHLAGLIAFEMSLLDATFGAILIKGYVLVLFSLELSILFICISHQYVLFLNFNSCH